MTIKLEKPSDIIPTHQYAEQEWKARFLAMVPGAQCVPYLSSYSKLRCSFEGGADLVVRWHEHTPDEVVQYADEHKLLHPLRRDTILETMARLRVQDIVATLPAAVLAEAEQALSGLMVLQAD